MKFRLLLPAAGFLAKNFSVTVRWAHLPLPPIANWPERGVYAASSFGSPQVNHFVHVRRTLKRPEGRAPEDSARCA